LFRSLAPCPAFERRRDLPLLPRRLVAEPAADVERIRAEADQPLVRRSAEGPEGLEVVDRLEQVRLPRAVVPDDRGADGREREFELREVAEIPEAQLDTDQREDRGTHGARNIPPRGPAGKGAGPPRAARPRRRRPRPGEAVDAPGYRPWNCGGRFSRKACIPSRMSAVAASSPNRCASKDSASSTAVS